MKTIMMVIIVQMTVAAGIDPKTTPLPLEQEVKAAAFTEFDSKQACEAFGRNLDRLAANGNFIAYWGCGPKAIATLKVDAKPKAAK